MKYAVAVVLFVLSAGVVYAQSSTPLDVQEEDPNYNQANNAFVGSKVQDLPKERADQFRIPVLGVATRDIVDSWGDARADGRTHEGNDILAPRGAFILSPTPAVVSKIGTGVNGGKYVYTYNPGGERYYYAHLDAYAPGLAIGQVLQTGDLIGFVGNTGNASGGPPHLHLGIYNRGAQNPYSRLTMEFSLEEAMAAIAKVLAASEDKDVMAAKIETLYKKYLNDATAKGIPLPPIIALSRAKGALAELASRDLEDGAKGQSVVALQAFLIISGKGPAAEALKEAGATGYFGAVTKNALIEFQKAEGIAPASGYYGPKTRAAINAGKTAVVAKTTSEIKRITFDLEEGDLGDEVIILQEFLIVQKSGSVAASLENTGATGVFGPLTKKALAEYQRVQGIAPATGYFGPKTRAHIASL